MIPRYTRPQMASIWNEQNKYRLWLEIEILAAEAMEQNNQIPTGTSKKLRQKQNKIQQFNTNRINQIETKTNHDVIAFLTYISEIFGPEARILHKGMTSSDITDTTFQKQLVESTDLLLQEINKLLAALANKAQHHKYTICIGRTHGIHAEPTSFGLKMAFAYAEFSRARNRLVNARKEIATCAISGAVGTYAHIGTEIEAYIAKHLNLQIEPISSQIIPRDRHAMWFSTLAVIASSIERLAVELRHLQRSEIMETREAFSKEQKGSSAMPHKRNPILSENLTGLARLMRSYALPAQENIALWHERDISHSAVERVIGPDSAMILDFALHRLTELIEKLVIDPDAMRRNLDQYGAIVHSQSVLLALVDKGLSRESAYQLIQRNAMTSLDQKSSFRDLIQADAEITSHLTPQEIMHCFDNARHLKYVDEIFTRIFPSG